MNVGELKKLLDGLDDTNLVIVDNQDDYEVARSVRDLVLSGEYDSAWDQDKRERVTGKAVYISV